MIYANRQRETMDGALPVAVLLDQAALHINNYPLKFALGGLAYVTVSMMASSVGVSNAYWNVFSTLLGFVIGGELLSYDTRKMAGAAMTLAGLYLLDGGAI